MANAKMMAILIRKVLVFYSTLGVVGGYTRQFRKGELSLRNPSECLSSTKAEYVSKCVTLYTMDGLTTA